MKKITLAQKEVIDELRDTSVVLLVKYDRPTCDRVVAAFVHNKNLKDITNLNSRRINPKTAEAVIDGGYAVPNGTNPGGYTEYIKYVKGK
jgi:hypothetical protein